MKVTEAKIQLLNAEGFAGVQIDCGEEDGSQVDLLDEVETHLDVIGVQKYELPDEVREEYEKALVKADALAAEGEE